MSEQEKQKKQEKTPNEILEIFKEEYEKKLNGREMIAIISTVDLCRPESLYQNLAPNATCISVVLVKEEWFKPTGFKFPSEFMGLPVIILLID